MGRSPASSEPNFKPVKTVPKTNIYIPLLQRRNGRLPEYGTLPHALLTIPTPPPHGPILAHRLDAPGSGGARRRAYILGTLVLPLHIPLHVDLHKVRRQFAYVVSWRDRPQVRVAVPGMDILKYVTPRTLEEFEFGEWQTKERERERQEELEAAEAVEAVRKFEEATVSGQREESGHTLGKAKRKRGRPGRDASSLMEPPKSPPRVAMVVGMGHSPGKRKGKGKRVEEAEQTEPEEEAEWSDGLAAVVHLGTQVCTDDYWYDMGHEEEDGEEDDMQMLDPNARMTRGRFLGEVADDEDEDSVFDTDNQQPPRKRSRGMDSELSSGRESSPIPALSVMPARPCHPSNPMRQKIIRNLNNAHGGNRGSGDVMLTQAKDFLPATSVVAAEEAPSMRRGRDSPAASAPWSRVSPASTRATVATKMATPFVTAKQRGRARATSGANGSPTTSVPATPSEMLQTSRWGNSSDYDQTDGESATSGALALPVPVARFLQKPSSLSQSSSSSVTASPRKQLDFAYSSAPPRPSSLSHAKLKSEGVKARQPPVQVVVEEPKEEEYDEHCEDETWEVESWKTTGTWTGYNFFSCGGRATGPRKTTRRGSLGKMLVACWWKSTCLDRKKGRKRGRRRRECCIPGALEPVKCTRLETGREKGMPGVQ